MRANVVKDKLQISFDYSASRVEEIKQLEGSKWSAAGKAWTIRVTDESLAFLERHKAAMDEQTQEWLLAQIDGLDKERTIQGLKKELSRVTEAPAIDSLDKLLPEDLKPFSFQWATPHYAEISSGRFILADSMGLGKSYQALLAANTNRFKDYPVLICCPKSACDVWIKDIKKFLGCNSVVVTDLLEKLTDGIRYYICSYSQLNKLKKDLGFFWILDESHFLKSRKTQRSRAVKALAKNAVGVIMLTGTPVQNRPEELYQQLAILKPDFMSFTSFMKKYCAATWNYWGGYTTTGASNLGELHEYLFSNWLIRREKEAVLPMLPSKTRQIIELSRKAIVAESILEMFSKNAQAKIVDALFLEFVEMMLESDQKVIFFAHHQVMLDGLEALCKNAGKAFIRIDGSTPTEGKHKTRGELVEQFQTDEGTHIALLSLKAAGTALTLTAASTMVMAELTWVPGDLLQAEDRINRISQKNACTIYYPLFSAFEAELYSMIIAKLTVISQIVEGTSAIGSESGGGLMKAMAEKFGLPMQLTKKTP